MGVNDGQSVSAGVTNPAFIDANADDQTLFKLGLNDQDPSLVSGAQVTNTQRELNSISSFLGKALNAIKNILPSYTNDEGFTASQDIFNRVDSVSGKFKTIGGHSHNPAVAGDGTPVEASYLQNVALKALVNQGVNITGATGTSSDITSQFTLKSPSSNETTKGVVVNTPYNSVILREAGGPDQGESFDDGSGNIVYGRITFSVGVWTLSFYSLVVGVETPYSFASPTDISFYYQEIFNTLIEGPTYNPMLFIPSDNLTADVVDATPSTRGVVNTTSQSFGGIKEFVDGLITKTFMRFVDSGSNYINAKAPATVPVSYDFTYPADPGNSGDTLFSDGAANTYWGPAVGSSGGGFTKKVFTGNGSQTVFDLTINPGSVLNTNVYINGLYQEKDTYSLLGTNITFTEAPPNLLKIEVMIGTAAPFVITADYRTDPFVGDGSTVNFNLSATPISMDAISVFVGGLYQEEDTYSLAGSILTFSEAPPLGVKINVKIGTAAPIAMTTPPGMVVDYAGASAPTGWLLCDGSAVSRTTYADIFAAIGTIWGIGDGSTTFNLPPTPGRTSIGAGSGVGLTPRTLGQLLGEETHALTLGELAAHSHETNIGPQTGGDGGATTTATLSVVGVGNVVANQPGVAATKLATNAKGSGTAHNNMQPSIVFNKIIKT